MRFSVIAPDALPLAKCEDWITANINLCWTSAKSWEMEQVQVCGLCELHNRTKAMQQAPAQVITLQTVWGICKQCGHRTYKKRQICWACHQRPGYSRKKKLKLVKG